jgi:tetratricopeptide (TPR) repeat protein
MNLDAPPDRVFRCNVKIDHYRTKAYDPKRNLESLRKVYESDKCSPRIKFYYGKELSDCGYWDQAITVLEKYIEEAEDFKDNLTVACIRMSKYYMEKKEYDTSKQYAMKGMRFNSIYAENYVHIGMIYEKDKDTDTACKYYKEAMTKKLEGGMSQLIDYYGYIPAARMALIYFEQRDYEEAMKYCKMAQEHKPEDNQMRELAKGIRLELDRLGEGKTLLEAEEKEIEQFFSTKNYSYSLIKNNNQIFLSKV